MLYMVTSIYINVKMVCGIGIEHVLLFVVKSCLCVVLCSNQSIRTKELFLYRYIVSVIIIINTKRKKKMKKESMS